MGQGLLTSFADDEPKILLSSLWLIKKWGTEKSILAAIMTIANRLDAR